MAPPEDSDTPPAEAGAPAPVDLPTDPLAEVAAWRVRGAAEADPVRWHQIEALARRAQAQPGAVGQLLTQRVSVLLQAYGAPGAQEHDSTSTEAAQAAQATQQQATPSCGGPLAALVASLASHAAVLPSTLPPTPGRPAATPEPAGPQELKSLHYFRDTWTRLAADRRLAQAEAALPDNAGPLNSQLLVHRALQQMRETSPAYLQHFMGYVEALLWMEQAQQTQATSRSAAVGKDTTPAKGRPRPKTGTGTRKR